MDRLVFFGRVLPEFINFSLPVSPPIRLQNPNSGLDVTCRVLTKNSAVQIDCESHGVYDFADIHCRVYDAAKIPIDLECFALGVSLDLIIDRYIDRDSREYRLISRIDDLGALCTASDSFASGSFDSFAEMYHLVATDLDLYMALNDLIAAIRVPRHAVLGCARAIESLRNIVKEPDMEVPAAWEKLRSVLNIHRSYLELIISNSVAWRHGDRVHISRETCHEIFVRSWIIMNRFLEYRKRGDTSLPVNDFPALV